VVQCVAACCTTVQCGFKMCWRCSVLQCGAVRCSVLQCGAVCCSVLHYGAVRLQDVLAQFNTSAFLLGPSNVPGCDFLVYSAQMKSSSINLFFNKKLCQYIYFLIYRLASRLGTAQMIIILRHTKKSSI